MNLNNSSMQMSNADKMHKNWTKDEDYYLNTS